MSTPIDPFVELGQWLNATEVQSGVCRAYWLIDPALVDPTLTIPELKSCAHHPLSILHPDAASLPAPYLLMPPSGSQADRLHDRLLSHALEEAAQVRPLEPQPRSIAALLMTDLALPDLVWGLCRAAVVLDTAGQRRILRYWDPRITLQLSATPTLRTLMPRWQAVVRWAHLQRNAHGTHWIRHELGGQVAHPSQATTLTVLQQQALQRIGLTQRLRAQLVQAKQMCTQEDLTLALEAFQGNVFDESSLICLAAQRLNRGVAIERSPRLNGLIDTATQQALPLTALLDELTDEDWTDIESSVLLSRTPQESRHP